MKLPGIDYSAPVQGTAQTAGLPYEAAAGAAKTISEGLRAYSQELIKTQQQEAAVKVAEGLNQAELEIKARKYVTPEQLRSTFGEAMPAHVRERIAAAEELKGSFGDPTADQIPMWEVGDALYAMKAKQLTEAAAKGISGTRWQTAFKGRMAEHVVNRQHGMATYQLEAMDQHIQAQQLSQIDRMVNARDFGGAKALLDNSLALAPPTRAKVGAIIETAKQVAPAAAALESGDLSVIRAQVARLQGDPAARAAIPEGERAKLIASLENKGRALEGGQLARAIELDVVARVGSAPSLGLKLAEVDKIKDPLLADVTRAIVERRHADQVAAQAEVEKQAVARVFGRIIDARGAYSLAADPDFEGLSDFGKTQAKDKLDSERRQARAEGRASSSEAAEARRQQAALNQEALYSFAALPLEEKVKVDTVGTYAAVDKPTAARLRADQQRARQLFDRGLAVPFGEFKTRAATAVASFNKKAQQEFVAAMERWYFDWQGQKGNEGKQPTEAEVTKVLGERLVRLDVPWGFDKFAYQVDDPGKYQALPPAEQPIALGRAEAERRLGGPPAPKGPAVGTRVPGEAIGYSGGTFEMQPNGKWKRVQ